MRPSPASDRRILARPCVFGAIARVDSSPSFFVRFAEGVRGPMAAEHLRDLAGAGFVTRDTEVAPAANGPWTRLAAHAIYAEVFPERRGIAFKAAQFDQVADRTAPALDPDRVLLEANSPPASFRGREILVTPQGVRGTGDGEAPNEVQQMVQEVGRRVAAHARRSRRLRRHHRRSRAGGGSSRSACSAARASCASRCSTSGATIRCPCRSCSCGWRSTMGSWCS